MADAPMITVIVIVIGRNESDMLLQAAMFDRIGGFGLTPIEREEPELYLHTRRAG